MIFRRLPGTLRSRIFVFFLLPLIPVLLLLVGSVELVMVPYFRNNAERELTNSTQLLTSAVQTSASIAIRNHLQALAEKNLTLARHYLALVDGGKMTRAEALVAIRKIFLEQPVGSSGYIYCLDSRGELTVHPNRFLQGTNVSSFAFVKEQMDRKNGYLEYEWRNPGERELRKKALFMVYLAELDWIISASSYRSEFSQLIDPEDFQQTVLSLRFGTSGYCFVVDAAGAVLVHPQMDGGDRASRDEVTASLRQRLIEERSGSFVFSSEQTGGLPAQEKLVVFRTIDEYGWLVAAVSPMEEIMAPVEVIRMILHGAVVVLLVASAMASYLLSGRLTRPLQDLIEHLDRNTGLVSPEPLPVAKKDELGRLAGEFNSFVQKIRQQTEAIGRERERYQSLFEASPDAILLLQGTIITDCNPAALKMFGATRRELIGTSVLAVSPEVQPNGKRSELAAQEILQDLTDPQMVDLFYWRHSRMDGTAFEAEVRIRPFPEAPHARTVAFVQDVTERLRAERAVRESEEQYRNLVENAHDAILIVQDGKVVFANHQTASIIGYTDIELKAKPFTHFIHPADRELVTQRHARRLQGDKSLPQNYQFRLETKAKEEIVVQLSAVLIQWRDRPATLNFIRDITEQKRLENAFQQAQKMEAVGTLAGGIAHDFNNLLMGIQGRAELLRLVGGEREREHALAIEDYVRSASGLTRQLLGFARGGKYQPMPIDLNQLVQKSSELFGRTKKEIRTTVRSAPEPVVVEVDRPQVEQVLLNMYVNAWQAMPQGGELAVAIETGVLDESFCQPHGVVAGRFAVVSITDTGTGIEESIRKRIFEPFFSTKEGGRGTGLGLASSYGIVRNHGGFIQVDSAVGHGSTFTIYLPLSEKMPVVQVPEQQPAMSVAGSETVLLIDDERMILEVGQAMLEQLGFKVLTAQGGGAGLEVLAQQGERIDLVILDVIMPGMDGSEVLERIRQTRRSLPVVLSSGYALDRKMEQLLLGKGSGFLQKPFSMVELSSLVRRVLDAR